MKRIFIIQLLLFPLIASPVFSETRHYIYRGPKNEFIQKFVDELASSRLRFEIARLYDEKKDGFLGLKLYLLPGRRLVDIKIYNNNTITVVKMFYENSYDGKLFQDIFRRMKLEEEGNDNFDDSLPPGWPSPR